MRQQFLELCRMPQGKFNPTRAWSVYSEALTAGALDQIEDSILLKFATRLVERAESLYSSSVSLEELRSWGTRIHAILGELHREDLNEDQAFAHKCIMSRASALMDSLEEPMALIDETKDGYLEDRHRALMIPVYEAVFLSLVHHRSPYGGLVFLLNEWKTISSYTVSRKRMTLPGVLVAPAGSLRKTVHKVLRDIEMPALVLADHRRVWDKEQKMRAGELLIQVLSEADLPEDALDVLEEMQAQSLTPSLMIRLTLVRALVRADSFELANSIFWRVTESLPAGPTFKYHLSTGLYLFAHQGDTGRAEEFYELLQKQGWVSPPDVATLMHASAAIGDTKGVVALFHKFFPEDGEGDSRAGAVSILHYTSVIYAHAQQSDFDGMNHWLEKMAKAGIMPDAYVYGIVLQSFARRHDVESMAAVMDQMRSTGIRPNYVAYTTVLSVLARRRDPVAAEAMYKQALQDGIVPDRKMLLTLMNAHVEAGSWRGVIRVFDYMKASRLRHLRLTPAVYNTLLKAYVLIGAPFRVVSELFDKLRDVKIRPDAYTFALLMQSACDAGEMDVAADIFQQMETLSEHWQSSLHINAYVMTILMAGYLRAGDRQRAKAVYDGMRERGIQPTSVTFASIIKAYGNEKTEESLQMAEDFLASLVDSDPSDRVWERTAGSRAAALDNIYAPLMTVYARDADPENVERLYQGMLDAGGEPTIGLLTMLLDAYRRKGDVQAALKIWPQIFQIGLDMSQVGPLFQGQELSQEHTERRNSTLLCIPLSIYIDALSAAGLHIEIALTWKKLQMLGFSFDSHNWNHLAVALVRAGELERAFEILERVILPYQMQSERILRTRERDPDSPFLFDQPPPEDNLPETAAAPANRRAARRAEAIETASSWMGSLAEVDEGRDDDFAHQLHVLHQISPSWNQWRPHAVTLDVLAWTLEKLERGQVIEPIRPDQDSSDHPEQDEDEDARLARVRLCGEIYDRILSNYHQAVLAVQEHKRRRGLEELRSTRTMRYTSVG